MKFDEKGNTPNMSMASSAAAVDFTKLESLLHKCSMFGHIKQLHAVLLTSGAFLRSVPLRTGLVDLCALSPFGHLDHALAAFRSTPSSVITTNDWNSALRSLAAGPDPALALSLLARRMLPSAPPRPDALTLSFALRAAARSSTHPAPLHALLLRLGVAADVRLATTLLDAYAKHVGDPYALAAAQKVFDEMPIRDVASWNALLAGLALGPQPHTALALFRRLASSYSSLPPRECPNEITVIAAASACAQLGSPLDAVSVQAFASARGLDADVNVQNALVDMHAKCGSLDRALATFRAIPPASRTLVSWNALLMALAAHGSGALALRLFDCELRLEPDAVTYLAVLCACVHAGLVDDGLRVFRSMRTRPNVKHYGAVVDLLGRAGRLQEAYDIIISMSFKPDVVLWQTMLGACKVHGNLALAEVVAEKLVGMGSKGCGDYVLLSNLYAARERWADVGRVRDAMASDDVRKIPGFSYVEVGGAMHRFVNGDQEHEACLEIYEALEEMEARARALGYAPDTSNVLHDIGEEDKQWALWRHSEKLAMAFGLIRTPAGSEIQVNKNLRICSDCHAAAKLVSRAYGRAIIIRDRTRFHRFEDGHCSCGDYW